MALMDHLATPSFTPRRILVVTLADLGDALLTMPALQALRQSFPAARIVALTTPVGSAALRDQPLDELIVFEKQCFNSPRALLQPDNLRYAAHLWRRLRAEHFDACVILHHLTTWFGTLKYAALALASGANRRYGLDNGRGFFLTDRVHDAGFGARHQAEYWIDLVGLLGAQARQTQPLTSTEAEQAAAEKLLGSRGQANLPLIALHPGSGAFAPARRWSPQRFAELADTLIEDGARIVLVGGGEEADLRRAVLSQMRHAGSVIDVGGRTALGELAAVLQRCTLFVGNDSGLAHLAGSVGTPVVAIFGPTDPRAWGPYGGEPWQPLDGSRNGVEVLHSGQHAALKANIACSPCIYRGHTLGTPQGCPDRTCLQRISVDQVLAVVRQQLSNRTKQVCGSTTF
ncbi:MAG TPA: glycosyltransferase family 9 protein [Herpetosiphonaceae bacterium]